MKGKLKGKCEHVVSKKHKLNSNIKKTSSHLWYEFRLLSIWNSGSHFQYIPITTKGCILPYNLSEVPHKKCFKVHIQRINSQTSSLGLCFSSDHGEMRYAGNSTSDMGPLPIMVWGSQMGYNPTGNSKSDMGPLPIMVWSSQMEYNPR